MPADRTPSRRAVLTTTGAAIATTSLAGCASRALSRSNGGADTTTTGPASTVTVTVGPNGELRFEPTDVTVRPGTTVRWTWKSDNHNLAVETRPTGSDWRGTPGGTSKLYDAGYTYEHTFTTLGTYEYYCTPHEAVGMVGTVSVTENPRSTTEETESHATTESAPETSTESDAVTDVRGRRDVTVAVGPGGELAFAPDRLRLSAGTTVTWEWQSDNHNIVVDSQPDEADWSGTRGESSETYDRGHTYSSTFTTSGTYEYFCQPHKPAGMTGTLIVE